MTASRRSKPLGLLLVGLGGFCVLMALGIWQVQRLQWKQELIAEAERRIAASPEALPAALDPVKNDYLPVELTGEFEHGAEIYFLTSLKPYGPGFEVITPFETASGRRILINRGFIPEDRRARETRPETLVPGVQPVSGILRWPEDRSFFTPDPNLEKREFYARDVDTLAKLAGTEPVLVQQAPGKGQDWPRPPKAQISMRNNHLQYALTWFGLAAVWAVMSLLWWRRAGQ